MYYRKAIDAFVSDPDAPWDQAVLEEPPSAMEQQVARIWSEVLGNPDIGRHDDFAAVGGHSLLATRIVARIRQELGRNLSLSTFCRGRTIASLARALELDNVHLERQI